MCYILAMRTMEGQISIGANLRTKAAIYIKVLYFGFEDAGRENFPRLLCPLQNARSPKYSAFTLWNRTGAPPALLLAAASS